MIKDGTNISVVIGQKGSNGIEKLLENTFLINDCTCAAKFLK